jgi:hypothetical protein
MTLETAQHHGPTFWQRVRAVAEKEFIQVRRDPILPRIIVLLPIMLLVLFGYALNNSIKNIPLAVFDASNDRISTALKRSFTAEERFKIEAFDSLEAALDAVRGGRVRAVLEIPAGALETARRNRTVPYKLYVDGSDPSVAAQVRAGAGAAGQELATQLIAGRALATPGLTAPLSPKVETLYNPDNRTAVYMVPGLIGLILTQITVLLTAIAIVREREVGTMEALIATPVKPLEVVLGKIAPYLLFGLIDAIIVLVVGVWVFGVPLVGSRARIARGGHRDFNRDEHADSSDVRHHRVPVSEYFPVRVAVPARGHECVFHRDFVSDSVALLFACCSRRDAARCGVREFMARDCRIECFFHCDAGASERAVSQDVVKFVGAAVLLNNRNSRG